MSLAFGMSASVGTVSIFNLLFFFGATVKEMTHKYEEEKYERLLLLVLCVIIKIFIFREILINEITARTPKGMAWL